MAKRRVLPAHEHAVGMVHPIDGPLARDGSEWTYDTFTARRLHDQSVVFDEVEVSTQDPDVETSEVEIVKPTKAVKSQSPKITTR